MNALQEKRNNLIEQLQNMNAAVVNGEEARAFTDEEQKQYDAIIQQINSIDASVKREDEIRDLDMKKGKKQQDEKTEADEIRSFDLMLRTLAGAKIEQRSGEDHNITYGDNGALIPSTIIPKIIDKVVEISPLFDLATKYYIKGNIIIPYVDTTDGDIVVGFADEFSELESTGIKFSSIDLNGYLAAVLVKISRQMINNTNFDIVSYVINYIARQIAVFTEKFMIKGDAINPDSGLANGVKQKVTITAAKDLTSDILIDVQDAVPGAYQGDACWIMNTGTKTAIRKLKDGQGNYLLIPDYREGGGWTLLGKPVYETDNLPAISDAKAGDTFLYYGSFSGLAVKLGESAELQMLLEKYATQHAIGLNVWFELDAEVENAQKIVSLGLAASTGD